MRILHWLSLLLAAASLQAAETELLTQELRIPRGEAQALTFETAVEADSTTCLETHARMQAKGLGGSMFFMGLKINGREVQAAPSRTAYRLTNRKLVSPVAPDLPSPWYGVGGWRVIYAADFESATKQSFYEGNPYRLVLDVSDLVRAGSNTLEITNNATDALATRTGSDLDLIVAHALLRTTEGRSPALGAKDQMRHVINRGEPGAGPATYHGEMKPGGGFTLRIGQQRLAFETSISYPDAGINRLLPSREADREGQPGWSVTTTAGDGIGQCIARGPDYTVLRRVQFTPWCIRIADEVTNRHPGKALGLMVKHSLALKELGDPGVRLAGNADPAVNDYYAPANPSVWVRLGDSSLGMICEDDVFRAQARLWFDPDSVSAGLRTEMLYLPPGEAHTLRWSVYPVASGDYYDFINLVRLDWGSNYTVEGAWCFFVPDRIIDTPVEQLRKDLERLGVRYACSWGGWVDPKHDPKRIGFGSEVLSDYWADYRDRLRQAVAKLHTARPDLKALVYYDTQRDTHADAGARYRASRLTNAQGVHGSTEWGGRYSLTWSMVATLTGGFGKDTLDAVDVYMDQIGADGLYWDEMENVAYGYPLMTYDRPDGHSCLLDPATYTVKQQVGLTTLLGEGHRLAVIDKVRAKGGYIMGNGPTTTRELLAKRVQRMVEIQHNDVWAYEGNLDTPLGYASSRQDFANVTRALQMATLLVGTRRDYESEISRHLFPITPIELHRGYILGAERIVTMHSGRYGWPGEAAQATVRYFDNTGKLRDTQQVVAPGATGRIGVQLAQGEVAVIERHAATN